MEIAFLPLPRLAIGPLKQGIFCANSGISDYTVPTRIPTVPTRIPTVPTSIPTVPTSSPTVPRRPWGGHLAHFSGFSYDLAIIWARM